MESISNIFISCKSDKEVISIMEENSYNHDICEIGISLLEKPDNIMLIMQKTKYALNVCYAGTLRLNTFE
jgi:hypothetical protein